MPQPPSQPDLFPLNKAARGTISTGASNIPKASTFFLFSFAFTPFFGLCNNQQEPVVESKRSP